MYVCSGLTTVVAQNVDIPDSNFKAALLAHNPTIDTNGDGEIQVTEAASVTGVLSLNNSNISDLTGLEAFVNITALYANNNNITSINLQVLPNLLYLQISSNDSLTSLDASGMTNLQEIQVGGNNFVSLNTTGCTSLAYLTILSSDNLPNTGIDLSTNTALELLSIANADSITSIDLSTNVNISSLTIQGTSLASLDVSNITALQQLSVANNALTSLNVANGNNNNLLGGFNSQDNPNLLCIQIDANFTPPSSWVPNPEASYSDNCQSVLGASTVVKDTFNVYPNPAENYLYVVLESNTSATNVSLFDVTGKTLLKQVITDTRETLNVSQLKTGMYFLVIGNTTKKILIK